MTVLEGIDKALKLSMLLNGLITAIQDAQGKGSAQLDVELVASSDELDKAIEDMENKPGQ